MSVSGEKVLVTGAGGFIGSHLVETLVERGARVRCLVHYNSRNDQGHLEELRPDVRKELEVVAGDVCDPFGVRSAVEGCAVVFHLAALIGIPYSYVAPSSYVATNVTGTLNVLEAARTCGVARVLHTSTSETYGSAQYVPIDEKHPLVGQSPYAASKIAADQLALSYLRSFGTPVTVVRPFNTYGPRQSARAVVPTIVTQILTGNTIRLGSLEPVRDLTYARDTALGMVAAAETDRALGEVLNLGTGEGVSVGDLAKTLLRLTDRDLPIVTDPQRVRPEQSEVARLISDNSRAQSLTGWRPMTRLEAGLEETVRWIGSHLDRFKADVYNL